MFKLRNLYLEEMEEGGAPAAEPEQAPAVEPLLDSAEPELGESEYLLIDGIKGTGDRPDWYKADKYKSVAEQAKAYTELEKKLGAHTGAPKEGYVLPEGVSAEDDLVKEAIERASKHNINQEAFNDILELASAQAGVTEEISKEQELAKLGDNAGERIKQVEAYLKDKAQSMEQYEEISKLVSSAKDVELVESLMKLTSPPKLPIDGYEVPGKPTWQDIERELYRKDDQGNFLMSVDRAHAQKVERMKKEYGG